jgi:hypothetical protein
MSGLAGSTGASPRVIGLRGGAHGSGRRAAFGCHASIGTLIRAVRQHGSNRRGKCRSEQMKPAIQTEVHLAAVVGAAAWDPSLIVELETGAAASDECNEQDDERGHDGRES